VDLPTVCLTVFNVQRCNGATVCSGLKVSTIASNSGLDCNLSGYTIILYIIIHKSFNIMIIDSLFNFLFYLNEEII